MWAFGERSWRDFEQQLTARIRSGVDGISDEDVLSRDLDALAEPIDQAHRPRMPVLDFDNMSVSESEQLYAEPNGADPSPFGARRGQRCQVFAFYVPFSDPDGLLDVQPAGFSVGLPEVVLASGEIRFKVADLRGNPMAVRAEAEHTKRLILANLAGLAINVGQFNEQLRSSVIDLLADRKQRLEKRLRALAMVGYPIRDGEEALAFDAVDAPSEVSPLKLHPSIRATSTRALA